MTMHDQADFYGNLLCPLSSMEMRVRVDIIAVSASLLRRSLEEGVEGKAWWRERGSVACK